MKIRNVFANAIEDNQVEVKGYVAAEIPALKVSRNSAFVSFSGSWFHSRILDGKKESLYALVLQYGTLYLYWWPLVAAPKSWRCGPRVERLV